MKGKMWLFHKINNAIKKALKNWLFGKLDSVVTPGTIIEAGSEAELEIRMKLASMGLRIKRHQDLINKIYERVDTISALLAEMTRPPENEPETKKAITGNKARKQR